MTPRLFIKLTCLLCLISTEGTSGGLETSLRPVLRGNLIETVLSDSLIKRYGVYFKTLFQHAVQRRKFETF